MKVNSNCAFLQSYERLVLPDAWTCTCPATKPYSERASGFNETNYEKVTQRLSMDISVHACEWIFHVLQKLYLFISNFFFLRKTNMVCGRSFNAKCINFSSFFLFWFWCMIYSICLVLYILANEHYFILLKIDTSNTCIYITELKNYDACILNCLI